MCIDIDARDEAFYLAFAGVEPAGKRVLIGVDGSGSIGWASVAALPITAREGSAALAVVLAAPQLGTRIVGVTGGHDAIGAPLCRRVVRGRRARPASDPYRMSVGPGSVHCTVTSRGRHD
ncbi:hypothetical protein [Demequina sp.]|uniref:hypothetical protein n=1 Tax=Demequina sp. TaxID=2050685 RepID=UPI0025C6AE26|nr:hypothetical protein [Demequina sp.]